MRTHTLSSISFALFAQLLKIGSVLWHSGHIWHRCQLPVLVVLFSFSGDLETKLSREGHYIFTALLRLLFCFVEADQSMSIHVISNKRLTAKLFNVAEAGAMFATVDEAT